MARPTFGYKNKAGMRVPGTTTIIGRFKDSGGLMFWAFEQGKAAERGEINKLYDRRDEAAEAGTLAHEMVEASIRHQPAPDTSKYSPEVVKQAVQGFKNYCRWKDTTKMDIVEQETPLVSEEYQFGGTPDAIMVKGELALGDWKTSNGVYPDYLIQLAAYKQLWEENHPDRPITGGFHLCRFSKEHADFAHHFWSELDDAWEQFKLFRVAYDIDKKLKKRV
jgi:hypothetical protein